MSVIDLGIIAFAAFLLLIVSLFQRKSVPTLRVIPALTRLYRAVSLSVEDGTRLLIGLGGASLLTRNGAAPLAGLAMLRQLTERTSLSDRPPVAVAGEASLALLAQDTLEAGYLGAGAGEFYQPTTGRATGLTPFSAVAGTLPILRDENVSASVLVGHFGVEAALLADAAERENTFLLGTSDDPAVQSALYASASEVLIGEELFAPGAYLGASASHTASLTVQDILRFIIILALLAGAGLKLFGLF